jgi:Transglutaminase-like superfamily
MLLFLRAYLELIRFELYLNRAKFHQLHAKVCNCPVRNRFATQEELSRICLAFDRACIWYPKQVLCLQRSAATTILLRKHGLTAHMVIGAQQIPFKAHAWVEVDGRVVNDRPYMPEVYAVLDRC